MSDKHSLLYEFIIYITLFFCIHNLLFQQIMEKVYVPGFIQAKNKDSEVGWEEFSLKWVFTHLVMRLNSTRTY